ncbi:MAG: alpha-E domain-containing protein [Eubacterium sp.]|nr:alpha-E domain-containing protein [Eubacterium sp.]
MGIISVEHTDRLLWLGRYSERVYTTLRLFAKYFDSMIDLNDEEYERFCKSQDIPNIYTSIEDFSKRYCFDGNDPNSIYSNLMRAYDNAIVLREEIGSETLAYVQLAVYAMNKAAVSDAPLVKLQRVMDNIVAFWGIADDSIDNKNVRNLIKLGKRIERIDIYSRLKLDGADLRREMKRLNTRITAVNIRYSHKGLMHLNYLVEEDEPDYCEIVKEVEALIQ